MQTPIKYQISNTKSFNVVYQIQENAQVAFVEGTDVA